MEIRLTAVQAEKLQGLWQEHSGALHAMLVGWCGDPQNAADVLQEVFRRLAASPALMAKMNNTRAFLAVSARRIAVDFARRSATRTAYHTAAGVETPFSENPGPTDEALRGAIRRALESLPAEQRAVFEHKVLKGRTLEEISKLENISLNTAASRLRYAIDKIRGQLRPYYDDLNRKDFKKMKNDPSKTEDIAAERIITPLAPKRVPSVAPGLEGLAAMAPDACEAAPEIAVYEPDFVEALPAVELIEPEIARCGVGGDAWEANFPETVELPATDVEGPVSEGTEEAAEFVVSEEVPEMISCEIFPEGGIPEEWLKPIVCELPEDFFVTVFEGETENSVDGVVDGEFVDGEALPFGLEEGFEICVLPVPEEFSSSFDPQELLARYDGFLQENPDWLAGLAENQGDWFHEQVTTASAYFEKLEFGTPGEANAFDQWFSSNFGASADGTSEEGIGYGSEEPDYSDGSWSFDLKDLLVRYEDFLRENPDWGALDPDVMEAQVVTPSGHFAELEFGTASMAAAFDAWYTEVYAPVPADGSAVDGEISDGSGSFDPKEFLARYGEFLGENPDWIVENQGGEMQLQVITASSIFSDLEFNTPGEAAAFDSWYAKVYAPILVDGSGTDSGSINLSRPTDGEYGSVVSDNLYSGGKDFLETTGVITDSRNGLTGIPAEWMRGGTANTGSLVLGGGGASPVFAAAGGGVSEDGGAPTLGETGQTVVNGGALVTNGPAEQLSDNTAALSNGSKVVLDGGQVVSGDKAYAFNSEVGSGKLPDVETLGGIAAVPMEVAIPVETTSSFGNAAAGLAPTADQALIVEFGVLSPSEAPQAAQVSMLPRATDDLPQAIVFSGGGTTAASNSEGLSAAQNLSASDDALPHVAASAQASAPAQNSGIQVDAPTATAGAVAVGTVVHGGASAPSVRRPVPNA